MREYVLTLLVTAAVTYVLTPLVRRAAIRGGALHEARDRDVHVVPIPLLGGLAMYGGLAAGLLVATQLTPLNSVFASTGTLNMETGLLLAGGLIVAIGIVDDRWGMNPVSKLAGQVAAGAILVASGCELGWLPLPGGGTFSPTSNQAMVLTILVVVATINAVNFIDGLDGLAAGIVGIAAVSFFLYYYSLTHVLGLTAEAGPALASAVLAGMCLGFLPHNFFPARIFMGDTGSMLLGLLLAYAPISSISSLDPLTLASKEAYRVGTVNRFPELLPLLLPTAILVIPYADMLMAVIRRTRAGMSPFAPDRKHLHHRLLDIGHSHRLSVLIMYLWAAMFSALVVWLSIAKRPSWVFATITLGAVLALLLMSMPRLRWWERQRRRDLAPAVGSVPVGAPVPVGSAPVGSAPVGSVPVGVTAPPGGAGPPGGPAQAGRAGPAGAATPGSGPLRVGGPLPAAAPVPADEHGGWPATAADEHGGWPAPAAEPPAEEPVPQPGAAQPGAAQPDGRHAAEPDAGLAARRPPGTHGRAHGGLPRSVVGTIPPAVSAAERLPLTAPTEQERPDQPSSRPRSSGHARSGRLRSGQPSSGQPSSGQPSSDRPSSDRPDADNWAG